MPTQGADREAVDFQFLLELLQRLPVVQHRQFAMRIAGIISGAEFDREDIQALQFLEHFVEEKFARSAVKTPTFMGVNELLYSKRKNITEAARGTRMDQDSGRWSMPNCWHFL